MGQKHLKDCALLRGFDLRFGKSSVNKMKNIIFSAIVALLLFSVSNVAGQTSAPTDAGTPAGAGDRNLNDNNVKMRSVELERVKREAEKSGKSEYVVVNADATSKFSEIREDFEGMQKSQAAIVKAYTMTEKIDYAAISEAAASLNKNATRLNSNLFTTVQVKKKKKKKKKKGEETEGAKVQIESTKSVKDLIVELDNAIGEFVTSKMFGNLQVVEPEVAEKASKDLGRIIATSDLLSKEAEKLK